MESILNDPRLQFAITQSVAASKLDKNGEYKKALELYTVAVEAWHSISKSQKNIYLRERLHYHMNQYIQRAEQLQAMLRNKTLPLEHNCEKAVRRKSTNLEYNCNKADVYQNINPDIQSQESTINSTSIPPQDVTEEDKMREKILQSIISERPDVKWSDIAGLTAAKEALHEAVILPTRFPNLFTGQRRPWRGILLYGPPGTGKTQLAKAVAADANATIFSVSSADLVSKWQGESEKLVRSLFDVARLRRPSIIFIDEIDSMCGARSESDSESSRRMKTEFLIQMQGISYDSSQVFVLGATNVPWALDAAIRRRFERRIYIPLPDALARAQLLRLCMGSTPNTLTDEDFHLLASRTGGFSGADISVLVRDALFEPIRRCKSATHFRKTIEANGVEVYSPCDPGDNGADCKRMTLMSIPGDRLMPPDVTMDDFLSVMHHARPSVTAEDVAMHVNWTRKFGVEGS